MGRVVVVGSANIDMVARVDRLPRQGETMRALDVVIRPGGKGANQAVAARRLGADVVLYAAVGVDAFGRQVTAALDAAGVDVEHIVAVEAAPTGVAMIVVDVAGENSIVVANGANHALNRMAIAGLAADVRRGDVVVLQLEVPAETCLLAATTARDVGASVVLNAAPQPSIGDPYVAELLRSTDVVVANEIEALAMVGVARPAGSNGWIEVATALRGHGPRACVVTLGADGAVVCDDSGAVHQPAFAVSVIDTTGSGDAFCGALAAAIADGLSLTQAVRRGCAAGALASERLGAQSSLPTTADVDRLLESSG